MHLLDARSQWHRVGLYARGRASRRSRCWPRCCLYRPRPGPVPELARGEGANLPAAIDAILKRNVSVLMLADVGTLPHEISERLGDWVKKGGVLVRFAGPRLEKGGDDLLPVALRLGGRTLGGALSWSTPQPLAPFGDQGPFAGLPVPPEVLVSRQVLADPASLGPEVKVWARLKDGTPLVTSAKRGDGQVVFFHVTANSDWSNLPLSGLFVEMLRRITTLGRLGGGRESQAADTSDDKAATVEVLSPLQVLDGFGLLKSPPPTTQGIVASKIADAKPNAENPPEPHGPAGRRGAQPADRGTSLPAAAEPPRRVSSGARHEGNAAHPISSRSCWLPPWAPVVRRHPGGAVAAGGRLRVPAQAGLAVPLPEWWRPSPLARARSR